MARADRMRQKAKQGQQATRNALDNLRRGSKSPGSEPYREEMDSVSEVTIGKEGIQIKKAPAWLTLAFGAMALAAFVAWLYLKR